MAESWSAPIPINAPLAAGYQAGLPVGLTNLPATLAKLVPGRPDAITMMKGVARTAFCDITDAVLAFAADAREQRRRDEERQQYVRTAEPGSGERQRPDDERGAGTVECQRACAPGRECDDGRSRRAQGKVRPRQAVTAPRTPSNPSIV